MLNARHHSWMMKKIFHSRLRKTASNQHFYLNEKHQISILEDFHKKGLQWGAMQKIIWK